jgi:branched-chain amino acid transport system substrate-binding protein
MRRPSARTVRTAAVTILAAATVAACGLSSTGTPSTSNNGEPTGTPIKVGVSLSLTGQFSADGQASLRGYRLWVDDVNGNGGLLGRPVRLVVLNDNSDPNVVKKNYTTLIVQDHVDLTLGPFSSLLTVPAAKVANTHGYAMTAGSATAPIVYQASLPNLFSTSAPVQQQMVPFAKWVAAMPSGQRPKTAAYAMVDDPFADPPVQQAQSILEQAGVTTVYSNSSAPYQKTTTAALTADADKVAAAHPNIVLIGSVDVPTVAAFINEFKRLRFSPQMIIAAAGPDQGQQFLNQIGTSNADGIMVPNTWYGGFPDPLSHVMVQEYIAKYGGTASDINGDVAEAYSAGQVMADAVDSVGLSQQKIIGFLHSRGTQVNTVQGLAQWGRYVKGRPSGQNLKASAFVFQWQAGTPPRFVQVLSLQGKPSRHIVFPKPVWVTG